MENSKQDKLLIEIESQLNGKQAGTIVVSSDCTVEPGEWIDEYFVADCLELNENVYIVVIRGTLQGLSIVYIQAPHDILGALIGRSGENVNRILSLMNQSGFAADKISFKDASVPPVQYD